MPAVSVLMPTFKQKEFISRALDSLLAQTLKDWEAVIVDRYFSDIYQSMPLFGYTNEHAFTRITEFKHLTGQEHHKTSLVYEYPCAEGDPYYPIPRPENAAIYRKYKQLAEAEQGVHFAGRLATYKYYNMDQVTAQALTLYARIMDMPRPEALTAHSNNPFQIDMPCSLLNTQLADEADFKEHIK